MVKCKKAEEKDCVVKELKEKAEAQENHLLEVLICIQDQEEADNQAKAYTPDQEEAEVSQEVLLFPLMHPQKRMKTLLFDAPSSKEEIRRKGMTTSDLNNYLKDYPNFIGTYPRDAIINIELTPSEKLNSCMVINYENKGGTHWVGLCIKNGKPYYFDSYGLPPLPSVNTMLFNNGFYTLMSNDERVQGAESTLCGFWVIEFLTALMINNIPFALFMLQFDSGGSLENKRTIENKYM